MQLGWKVYIGFPADPFYAISRKQLAFHSSRRIGVSIDDDDTRDCVLVITIPEIGNPMRRLVDSRHLHGHNKRHRSRYMPNTHTYQFLVPAPTAALSIPPGRRRLSPPHTANPPHAGTQT
ncbi:hypothetical protein EDC01DRAFT_631432 [Geopyxis carbonaria]|nr:hypothetical protein EDC01DRAFT_631432 [Geopyxis carbonaria]